MGLPHTSSPLAGSWGRDHGLPFVQTLGRLRFRYSELFLSLRRLSSLGSYKFYVLTLLTLPQLDVDTLSSEELAFDFYFSVTDRFKSSSELFGYGAGHISNEVST